MTGARQWRGNDLAANAGLAALCELPASSVEGRPGALRAAMRRDGHVVVRGLLDGELVAAARARLRGACERAGLGDGAEPPRGFDDPRLVAVHVEVLPSDELLALAAAPALHRALDAALGGPAERRGGDICRVVPPGHPRLATPPHQDAHYMRAAPPLCIAWIPLGDCPIERGPLAVIAGSHAGGLRPHRGASLAAQRADVEPAERWSAAPLAAGDVLILDALTVHCALPNTSSEVRLSVDLRFAGRGA